MAKVKMVCVKEIYTPATTTRMEYRAFGGETTYGKPFEIPEHRVRVGQTYTARNQPEVKSLVKSGNWTIA